MSWTLELPEIKFVAGNAEVFDDVGNNTARDIARMPGECNNSIGAKGIGIMPMASRVAQVDAANLLEAAFQLTTIDRGIFSHKSSRQHEFVAECGRNRTAGFEQSFQMGLGCLLKTENRLPAVASMGVTAGKQSGFGNPHAVFVSPRLNFGNGDDHTEGTLTAFADAVNGCQQN